MVQERYTYLKNCRRPFKILNSDVSSVMLYCKSYIYKITSEDVFQTVYIHFCGWWLKSYQV